MARIRSIKPELRTDQTAAGWPREVRLAWVYLWGYLDDSGRGRDNLALLRADLFPLDRDVTEKKLDDWLTLISTTPGDSGDPPLCRYTIDGRRYLHAVRWKHQRINRPTPSKLPPCPRHGEHVSDSVNGSGDDSRIPSPNGAGGRH